MGLNTTSQSSVGADRIEAGHQGAMVRPAFSMNGMPHFALCSRKRFSSHPRVHVATFLRAVDEDIYNRRFETRDVGVRAFLRGLNDRHPCEGVPPQFLG